MASFRFCLVVTALVTGCSIEPFRTNAPGGSALLPRTRFDHSPLERVLQRFVDGRGRVDYVALKVDRGELDAYLESLGSADVAALQDDAERKAYWINAYNAITLAGILQFYPTGSIRDHPGFWTRILTNCGGRDVSLDEIEHQILRPMGDPRVHMAIVCASKSCPKLARHAYSGEGLDRQLDRASREFLADPFRNRFDDDRRIAYLSRLFSWFEEDFAIGPYNSVRGFLRRYAPPRPWLDGEFTIDYLDYDWSLNGLSSGK